MKIVISMGGSVLGNNPSAKVVGTLVESVNRLKESGDEVHIVVGGGPMKRLFVELARACGLTEYVGDVLGVGLTRVFARLVAEALGDSAHHSIPESIEDAVKAHSAGEILVMGGTEAGHSTTAVAALLAEALQASLLLKVSDVDGVYSKNPTKYPDAIRFDELTYGELATVLGTPEFMAGTYDVLDQMAIGVLGRANIPTVYFNGSRSLKDILSARRMEVGTYILGDNAASDLRSEVRTGLKALGYSFRNHPGSAGSASSRALIAVRGGVSHAVVWRARKVAGLEAVKEASQMRKDLSAGVAHLLAESFSEKAVAASVKLRVDLVNLGDFRRASLESRGSRLRSTKSLEPSKMF